MAQRKWQTALADIMEGETSEDKALLDIRRGLMINTRHESIGLWASHTLK